MLQTAGRVGGDPAAQDSGKREAAPPPLTSIRFGWVDGGGRPWPLSKQRTWTESRGASGLFPGTAVPWTAKIPVGVGGQFGGFGLWPSPHRCMVHSLVEGPHTEFISQQEIPLSPPALSS